MSLPRTGQFGNLFALVDNCRVRAHKEFEMCSVHVASWGGDKEESWRGAGRSRAARLAVS